ncbi:MAG: LPS-assembly protein LptD [Synechococcaceae cyanobacterium SM1_2_3]|nr:LPS-assembly protein LptD [Synechococcaceae cyanobacterium SM1_2_3]
MSNNLDFLTVNYLERHLDSRYYGNGWQALARVQGYQILNPALFAVSGKPYQRLPQLLLTGAWPSSGGGLNYQLYGEAVHFQQTDLVTGAPAGPVADPGLELSAVVGLHQTGGWGPLHRLSTERHRTRR